MVAAINSRLLANSQIERVDNLRVSVLVPTFNRANYIAECLDSLLAQTMPALEIILIDDGSEDGTAQLLKAYGQRIRYFRKDNGGKPTAVNLGLSLAQGELIWIFDDDDVALPLAIESRVLAIAAAPEAGFVFSSHFYGKDGLSGKIVQTRLQQVSRYHKDQLFFELMKGCFFSLNSALVRATVYQAVGGFDPHLLSSEDYDMALRLAAFAPVVQCMQPSFIVREHDGLRGANAIRYSGDQRATVFRKFDQQVGLKLRSTLLLGDYLVPRQQAIDDRVLERQGYLARMTVMASKACLKEMLDDLQSALALCSSQSELTVQEVGTISQSVCTGYAADAIDSEWSHFKILLKAIPPTRAGKAALNGIANGLFRLARGHPGSMSLRASRLAHALSVALIAVTR